MTPRIARACQGADGLAQALDRLVDLSVSSLPRMFDVERHEFVHTLALHHDGVVRRRGSSFRYGAIVVLGARHLGLDAQRSIFAGESAAQFCDRLLSRLAGIGNLGDVALATWAAAELARPSLPEVLKQLRERWAASSKTPTVEAAWVLSALASASRHCDTKAEATLVRERLVGAFSYRSGIFPHFLQLAHAPWPRAHVACFADQVYPIQALACFHRAFGDQEALRSATRCAEQICGLQGKDGQWWWHYDARTGTVVEGYPVYSVHQDAMAPMALFDLLAAGGGDFTTEIRRGVSWLFRPPECDVPLVDERESLIWRKVARSDPGKAVRKLRAGLTFVSPRLRASWLDWVFPARSIDHECRPYHLGWLLHAWLTLP